MKAVIPVAGAGLHIRPQKQIPNTALIPIGGKPILAHIVDNLINSGINEFVFITGYLADKIEHFITNRYPQIQSEFVFQTKREGLGHAIWQAGDYIRHEDEIIIVLGDTLFEVNLQYVLDEPYSSLGVHKVSNPSQFGIAEINNKGRVIRLVEKPIMPKSNLALVGLYKILQPSKLVDALDMNIKNNLRNRNEFQLIDGLMKLIEGGEIFTTFNVTNWYDCGKREILIRTNELFLNRPQNSTAIIPEFQNTIIKQPVFIGKDCIISNSIIGPNVTISENTVVDYCILKNSVVGSYASLKNIVLQNTIIGSDATIHGQSQSLNLADNSELVFE